MSPNSARSASAVSCGAGTTTSAPSARRCFTMERISSKLLSRAAMLPPVTQTLRRSPGVYIQGSVVHWELTGT